LPSKKINETLHFKVHMREPLKKNTMPFLIYLPVLVISKMTGQPYNLNNQSLSEYGFAVD
jgi:hypothetical protein